MKEIHPYIKEFSEKRTGPDFRLTSLVLMLSYRDMRVRYKRAWLGMAWSLATPLALAFVFTIVFRYIFGAPVDRYPLYVLAGLYPWMYLERAVKNATFSFQNSSEILRQVPVPKASLPIAEVAVEAFHLFGALILLCMIAPFLEATPGWHWLALAPVFLFTVIAAAGAGLVLATIQARFRDTKYIVEIGLMLLFYVTPIVYSDAMVPEPARPWMEINPVRLLIAPYQTIIHAGHSPGADQWAALAIFSIVAASIGFVATSVFGRNVADYV